jgi:hypothetical protein
MAERSAAQAREESEGAVMVSEGAREIARLYGELSHLDFFSAHGPDGHKCTVRAYDGEPCSLCLSECTCVACFVKLTLRGKETK